MTTALAKKENGGLVVASEIDEMFGNSNRPQIPIDAPLPQIAIMREKPLFDMPDGETVKEFEGHVIHWHEANQYFPTAYGEGSEVPACFSSNGRMPDGGEDMQAGPCAACQFNQYGSARDGGGKACQNTIRLYILVDGNVLPAVLKAPPSSLGKKESLMRWLTNSANITNKAGLGCAYQCIKVKFSLHTKNFDSGMSASVLDLVTVSVLDKDQDIDQIKMLAGLTKDFREHYLGQVAHHMANETETPAGVDTETGEILDDDTPL